MSYLRYAAVVCLVLTVQLIAPARLNAEDVKEKPKKDAKKEAKKETKEESKRVEAAPVSDFEMRNIEGWIVYIRKSDLTDHAEKMNKAIEHLENQLYQTRLTIPAAAAAITQERVPIWFEFDNDAATAFHPDFNWLLDRGYACPEGLGSLVSIAKAKGFWRGAYHQPCVVLHELTHGYGYMYLGEGRHYSNKRLGEAYDRMEKTKKYESVLCRYSKGTKHYGLSNKMEYFAESTEAYFGINDFYPFIRPELREYDPEMCALLEDMWGVDLDEQKRTTKSLAKFIDTKADETVVTAADTRQAFTPTSEYDKRQIDGWQVYVSPRLAKQKAYGDAICRLIEHKLHLIRRYMPEDSLDKLRKVAIWVEEDSSVVGYITSHTSAKTLKANGLNPDKLNAVEIGNCEKFSQWQGMQQYVLLRQLARVCYDRALSDEQLEKVKAGLKKCVEGKKYDSVLRFDGKYVCHPALLNTAEFFARMTEMYYGVSDHYPFLQFELFQHDPEMCDLMIDLWGGKAK